MKLKEYCLLVSSDLDRITGYVPKEAAIPRYLLRRDTDKEVFWKRTCH